MATEKKIHKVEIENEKVFHLKEENYFCSFVSFEFLHDFSFISVVFFDG